MILAISFRASKNGRNPVLDRWPRFYENKIGIALRALRALAQSPNVGCVFSKEE